MATMNEEILCRELKFNSGEVDEKKCVEFVLDTFKKSKKKEIVVVNIGTDRCTGDSYGPFLGSYMEENNCKISFYGTLEKPIHAKNLEKELRDIGITHTDAFIISVDAAVSVRKDVNKISLKNKPIKPGLGVGKDLISLGDMSITFISCESSLYSSINLGHVRLGMIYKAVKETFKIIRELENSFAEEYNLREIC